MGGKGSKGDKRDKAGTDGGSGGRGGANRPIEKVDINNIAASNPDYPPPYVPETLKDEIFTESVVKEIQNKLDEMPKTTDGSYTSLLKKLSTLADTEVQFVIAVYLWIKSQDYESDALDLVKNSDTPKGYMKMIKEGTGDHTSFFTIMCRRSGIPCMLMDGIGKGTDYSVGDSERQLGTRWTIVYADNEWHMAHIDWCMQANRDVDPNKPNKQSDDFFFLTDPDNFVQFCYPDNYQWQLLDRPVSKKEFLTLPNCRPKFYELDGTVVSPKTSTLKATNGKADIEISFPKSRMEQVNLSYRLSYMDTPNDDDDSANMLSNLQKFVFLNRKPTKFIFEVRLPVSGRYVMDIFGELEQTRTRDNNEEESDENTKPEIERFCQFKLVSNKTFQADDLEMMPECPTNGWGPGPRCKSLGLTPKSHLEGVIYIKPGESRNIVFKIKRKLDVTCQLTHNYLPVYVLVEQVECTTDRHEANIKIQIPEDGQYALKIYCRETGSKGYNDACMYLIRQRSSTRLPEKYRDKMIRSRLEHHIDNHTSEKELKDAMEVYKCYNVPDNGELKRAEEKMKQYWQTKRELRSAVNGRNVNVSHKWLDRAKHSKYKLDLQDEIQQAERMEKNVGRLKGNTHPIAKMDPQTMIEIRNYTRPSPIIRDVMKSTYTLLGEDSDELQDWEHIQYLMGRKGNEGLQKRVLARRAEDIPIEIAEEAEATIEPYNLQKCRAVSNGICSFFKWDKQMIRDVKKLDEEENERYERDHPLTDYEDLESYRDEQSRPLSRQTSKESRTNSKYSIPLSKESRPHSKQSKPRSGYLGGGNKLEEDGTRDTNHPFAVNDDEDYKPPPPRFAALKPAEQQDNVKPVAYSGWKPQDL